MHIMVQNGKQIYDIHNILYFIDYGVAKNLDKKNYQPNMSCKHDLDTRHEL